MFFLLAIVLVETQTEPKRSAFPLTVFSPANVLIFSKMESPSHYQSPCFTTRLDSRLFCDTQSSLDTHPDSPTPRARAYSQFKTERRHPHSPTPSPRRISKGIPISRTRVTKKPATEIYRKPDRTQEILKRIANLNCELKILHAELAKNAGDCDEESRAGYVPALSPRIDFPLTPDNAETPKVKWVAFKRPSVNKAN